MTKQVPIAVFRFAATVSKVHHHRPTNVSVPSSLQSYVILLQKNRNYWKNYCIEHQQRPIHHDAATTVDNLSPITVNVLTSTTTDDDDADNDSISKTKAESIENNAKQKQHQKQQQRIKFPWRHESGDNPIPRLVPNTTEFNNDTFFSDYGQAIFSYLFLQMPFWYVLFGNQLWRNELADSTAYAFTQGITNILSNIYSVHSIDSTTSDELQVRFIYPPPVRKEKQEITNRDDPLEMVATEVEEEKVLNNEEISKSSIKINDQTKQMISEPLWNLFQTAYEHGGKDTMQIRLEMEPTKAILYNIVCSPFVTREALEKDDKFHDEYIGVMKDLNINYQQGFIRWQKLAPHLFEDGTTTKSTIEVQVLVECKEIFQVKDLESGRIVQGSLDDSTVQKVYHMVRLERNVTTSFVSSFPYVYNSHYGDWQITDIDDLLTSRPWLRPKTLTI